MSETTIYSGYFLRLKVSDIRCFSAQQELVLMTGDRPARWTILLGDNGTGKTTLLQMIAWLRPGPEISSDHSEGPSLLWAGVDGFGWHAREDANGEKSAEIVLSVGFCRDLASSPVIVEWTGVYYPEALPHDAADLTKLAELGKGQCIVIGYGAYRRLRGAALQRSTTHDTFVSGLFDPESPLVPAEEWFLQRDYAVSKLVVDSPEHKRAKRSLDRVTRLLLSILPDVTALEAAIPDPAVGGAQLMATTHYGRVRVSDLGLGYQATLAWVTDLAARMTEAYPDSEDPLAEPAVVLVDEIDLHLHPRWQRALLESLSKQFRNVQWIVTAHSPLIVQNAPADSQIVVLRRDGDHVVIDNDPAHVRDWRLDQILTSDLFGLPSARPKRFDALIEERDRLLSKAELTPDDERRLDDLGAELDGLPVGEVPVEIEAMRVIQEAARAMKGSA